MILPLDVYPHAGPTLMNVCLQSLISSSVVLISTPASPDVQYFLQNNLIYIGGDAGAFGAKYPALVTPIVSLGSLSCYSFANLFIRFSSSSKSIKRSQLGFSHR